MGSDYGTATFPRGMVPAVDRVLDTAIDGFNASPKFACRHLLERQGWSSEPALLCCQHPRLGLTCLRCFATHIERHDFDVEHCCDACGGWFGTLFPVTLNLNAVALRVRTPRGKQARATGRIIVGGLGLCTSCRPAVSA